MGIIKEEYKTPILFVVIVVIAVLAYGALIIQDRRSSTDKMGDALHELPQELDKAERQLRSPTLGEKLDNVIKDVGD